MHPAVQQLLNQLAELTAAYPAWKPCLGNALHAAGAFALGDTAGALKYGMAALAALESPSA